MKRKYPLCVNLGAKRLYYLHVAGNFPKLYLPNLVPFIVKAKVTVA